ncbi:hypothetical protein HK096_008584 [Nowakowskiella sp. JEL0078]|nr:hypothetical protein HK096_008584 [Nowakowskiella sp. JEL0078]
MIAGIIDDQELLPIESISNIGLATSACGDTVASATASIAYNATTIAMSGKFFDKPANPKESASQKEKILCKLCNAGLTVQPCNYSNFISHAKSVHPFDWSAHTVLLGMCRLLELELWSNSRVATRHSSFGEHN